MLVAEELKGKIALYAGMNNVKFKNSVFPGDTVEFRREALKPFGAFRFMKAEGYVGGKVVLKGEFSFALVDSEKMKASV